MSATQQQAAVPQKGVSAAEQHRGAERRGKNPGYRIEDLGGPNPSPGQYPSAGKQVQVHGNNRPGEWCSPLPFRGLGLFHRESGAANSAILYRILPLFFTGNFKGAASEGGEGRQAGIGIG